MRAIILAFLFLIWNFTSGQDAFSETEMKKSVKLADICTCSEIHDATGTHFVLNILCSAVDRMEEFQDLDKVEWPPNPHGLKIEANFQALGITILANLPKSGIRSDDDDDDKEAGKDIELSEIGPRFQMKLYEIKLGTLDALTAADTEWALRPYMNTAAKRRFLSDDDGWQENDEEE